MSDDGTAEVEDDEDEAASAEDAPEENAADRSAGGGSGGSSVNVFGGAKKTGNKMCSWSWKEKRCEPAALCQYKYQVGALSDEIPHANMLS